MISEVDVVVRKKEGLLPNRMRTNSNLLLAKVHKVQTSRPVQKELIKLVQRLFLSGSSVQAVVFSAVDGGSGSTFISTQTAEILANQLGEPVCLVDANFRSPRINQHFEVEDWNGRRGIEELTLVVYRPSYADCPRLASLDRLQNLIADLRKRFTYIIIDAAPLIGYPDATLFARMSDGLVMVLEANFTRRETARKAKQLVETSGGSVLGAVLNRRDFPIPEMLYRRL